MHPRLTSLSIFLTLLSFSECRVKFAHSSLYDEFDFLGNIKVEIEECSGVAKCALFVSILSDDNSTQIYNNIQLSSERRGRNTSLTALASVRNANTKAIKPLIIEDLSETPSAKTIFFNDNVQQVAAPLVIYAVNLDNEPNVLNSSGVFDAADISRGAVVGGIATILSARPFTATIQGDKSTLATIFATGFDGAEVDGVTEDNCTSLMQTTLADPISFQINGPIASIVFSDIKGKLIVSRNNLTASLAFNNNLDLTSLGFVTSQGFTYRSTLYGEFMQYILTSTETQFVRQTVFVNTDGGHPLEVSVRGDRFGTRNYGGNDLFKPATACDAANLLDVYFEQTRTNSFALLYKIDNTDCAGNFVTPQQKPTEKIPTTTEESETTTVTASAFGYGTLYLLTPIVYRILV